MKPSTIKYFFRESFSGLKKNMLMTMASMVAVAACISILSFSYCVGSNLQYMLDQMEDSIGISVFLSGELTGEEIENMKRINEEREALLSENNEESLISEEDSEENENEN